MLAVLYRVLVRTTATRGRVLGLLALGVTGVVVGIGIGLSSDLTDAERLHAGTALTNTFGLSLFAPVATLVLASATLGDLAEDRTLVYLWARPLARWKLAVAAFGASVSVALPIVLGALGVAALATGAGGDLVAGTLAGAAVAVLAYAGVFTLVGLMVRRALVWGLAYVLLWEGFVASSGDNAARLAIRSYTRSLLSHATGEHIRLADRSVVASVVVPLVVAAVGVAVTVWDLRRTEVA
jgi:ABC-2 type transport system permease protein